MDVTKAYNEMTDYNIRNSFLIILCSIVAFYFGYYLWVEIIGLRFTKIIQISLLIVLIISLLKHISLTIKRERVRGFINWCYLLAIMQILSAILSGSHTTTQLKESLFVLMISAPFSNEVYRVTVFKKFCCCWCAILIFIFFFTMSNVRVTDENATASGYYALAILPIGLFLLKDSKWKYQVTLSIAIFLCTLLAVKRGDILACAIGIIVYFISFAFFDKSKRNSSIFVLCITLIIGYIVFSHLLTSFEYLQIRLNETLEGNSSGRDIIYSALWNNFTHADFTTKLLGGGFDATVKIIGTRAHSDWLEILTCEGIIGCIIYAGAMISLFREAIKSENIAEKSILLMILAIWLCKSTYSMFIYSQASIALFIIVGHILNKRIHNEQHQYDSVIM